MPKDAAQTLTEDFVKIQHPPESRKEVRDSELQGFFLRLEPSGRKTYYIQLDRTHKRKVGNAEVMELKIARNRARVIIGEHLSGKLQKQQDSRTTRLTLRQFLKDEYKPWSEINMRQGGQTIDRLMASCEPLLNTHLDKLTEKKIEDWKTARIKAGRADTTVKRDLSALKTALKRAVAWGLTDSNPAANVAVRVDHDDRVRYLHPDERERLLRALETRDQKLREDRASANEWRRERGYEELPEIRGFADYLHPLVLLVLNTGLRRSEALSLKWKDVDLEHTPQVTIWAAFSKKRKTRRVQLNSFAVKILKAWKKQGKGSYVFPNPANDLKIKRIDTAWGSLMKLAEIEDFRFHDLRHDFASQLVKRDVSLYKVQELLGHQSSQMTERYAHLAPKELAGAVEKLV